MRQRPPGDAASAFAISKVDGLGGKATVLSSHLSIFADHRERNAVRLLEGRAVGQCLAWRRVAVGFAGCGLGTAGGAEEEDAGDEAGGESGEL